MFLRGAAEVLQGWIIQREKSMHSVDLPSLEPNEAFILYYLTELLYMKICLMPRATPCLLLSQVWLFCSPMDQAPLSMGFSRQEILEQVAISLSRWSSGPRDRAHVSCVSCTGKQILYHRHLGYPPYQIPRELIFNLWLYHWRPKHHNHDFIKESKYHWIILF